MPEISGSLLFTLVTAIFSAGITYGVMSSKQKNNDKKIHEMISELKEAVKELKNLTTELQIMKASTIRNERDIEVHELRLTALEIAVAELKAKLQALT